jgi:hypothetical protein
MPSYVPIDAAEMQAVMRDMGFDALPQRPGAEIVYARTIGRRPVQLRVFSSVVPDAGVSREVGQDAIRIVLHSTTTDRPIPVEFSRVYRTKNALTTLKDRAREAWSYAKDHTCDRCHGVMVERTNRKTGERFMSCADWKECNQA